MVSLGLKAKFVGLGVGLVAEVRGLVHCGLVYFTVITLDQFKYESAFGT